MFWCQELKQKETCVIFKISNAKFACISQTADSGQNFRISLRELQFDKSNFTQEKVYKIQFVVRHNDWHTPALYTHDNIEGNKNMCDK